VPRIGVPVLAPVGIGLTNVDIVRWACDSEKRCAAASLLPTVHTGAPAPIGLRGGGGWAARVGFDGLFAIASTIGVRPDSGVERLSFSHQVGQTKIALHIGVRGSIVIPRHAHSHRYGRGVPQTLLTLGLYR
jgi:hypothetical protein